ncbi:toll-like receptor 6 [Pelodytes ibericus]
MASVIFCLLTLTSSFVCTWCYSPLFVVANYSGLGLRTVPNNFSMWTTVLDLSFNSIHALKNGDFSYMPELKALNMTHNALENLNGSVVSFNSKLEYADFSNNRLENITGTFPQNLRHLDLSFNNFKTMSMCKEFGNLLHLEYLGIGATQILKSEFEAIAHLQLQYMLIELESLTNYDNGSILLLNTKNLHIILPSDDMDPSNILVDAVNTSRFIELSNTNVADSKKYMPNVDKHSKVTHLTLRSFRLEWKNLVSALQCIWHSSVESVHIYDLTLLISIAEEPFDYSNTSMKEFLVEKATTTIFEFNQTVVYKFFAEMNIQNLTIKSANMLFMVCPLNPSPLAYINFANNALTDDIFIDCTTLTQLKSLVLAQNKLEKLSKTSSMTRYMPSLKHLDVSHNVLHYDNENCQWSESIVWLNMAHCSLANSVFTCLPKYLQTLILEYNEITYIPSAIIKLENLKQLNLASNRLSDLPDCSFFPGLVVLRAEFNQILSPSKESIQTCLNVKEINVGNNPFQCDCEIKYLINMERKSPGKIIGWPNAYHCDQPKEMTGINLQDFYIPEIYCNVYLLIAVITLPTVFFCALIFSLCRYYDGLWYLKMLCQWTRTKHRVRRTKKGYQELHRDLVFHAFVSYSEQDASWVKHTFLPNIEKHNSSLRICQHERNFVPGKSIVENIINCIDKSYKSIFILSPNFVQSEWCHYELYFAHHKLYTENTDNLILILLEPIPQYLIPSKYYKLKTLMSQRTYLEWPKETSKHGLFWANLRAAINISLSDSENQSSCSEPNVCT